MWRFAKLRRSPPPVQNVSQLRAWVCMTQVRIGRFVARTGGAHPSQLFSTALRAWVAADLYDSAQVAGAGRDVPGGTSGCDRFDGADVGMTVTGNSILGTATPPHRKQISHAFGPEKTPGDAAHKVSPCLTDGVDATGVVA